MIQFPSFRSQFVAKRTYNRPLDEDGKTFETFTQTIDRVINHQKWLWETAKGKLIGEDIDELTEEELSELEELRQLMLNYEAMVAGRTLWLGGTDISKKFHATQFNCSFSEIKTVHDLVDAYHNLLLGCGVGLEPITGILNGFTKPVEIEVIRSTRNNRGDDNNKERHYKRGDKRVWQLIIGDSGIAWAKAIGKLVAMKKPVDIIILDFSEVRPGGKPLKGFGWISSGDEQISKAFYEIALILNRRAGQLLSKIDILDIMNWLGTSLSSRRSAEIAIMPADDPEAEEFAGAKKDYWKTGNPQRSQSNNSLVFYHKPTKRELRGLFSQMLDAGGSEPGFINGAAARKRAPYFRGVNPCVISETGVYVADGRGIVTIGELAKENKDVPVFCFDNKNKVTVRMMRNPRLTGEKVPVYKITLDDGSEFITTENHKFKLLSGEYKEVSELNPGDSLKIISRFEATHKELFENFNSRGQDYFWIDSGQKKVNAEHSFIASFHYNIDYIPSGYVVHHKDFVGKNNQPENLIIMSKEEHDNYHGSLMVGENNPMVRAKTEWSEEKWADYRKKLSISNSGENNPNVNSVTNDELKIHMLELTKKLGYRPSKDDWRKYAQENNLPQSFSKWRQDHFGGILGLANWAATELGYENFDLDPRIQKRFLQESEQGYNVVIRNDQLLYVKNCEICGTEFETARKEHGICSNKSCKSQHFKNIQSDLTVAEKRTVSIKKYHEEHKSLVREEQAKIYNNLKFELQRDPFKVEWVNACKTNNVSPEISRKSSPLQSYNELKQYAANQNHKIVSIEFYGHEDVYNGTVDEFHNFFIACNDTVLENGKKKTSFINNLQCGEILLGDKSYCNLITINLNKFNGREKELHRAFWIMGRANYRQTCVDFRDDILQTTWHELNQFLHLTGMSCAGIVTWEHHKSPKHIAELRKIARCAVDSMAEELNLPKSKAVTCGKPDGSIGKIMDTTEGIHKPLSKYILNNIIISKSSPLLQVAIDSGYRCFEHPFDNSSMIVSLPICFENVEFDTVEINGKIMEVNLESAIDQLNRYKMWMDNFADHNISITVSYSPDEVEDIVDWLHSNWDHFVGVSFLLRADPTKTAEDLGYPYLPQQPITKEEYYEYVSKLKGVNLDSVFVNSLEELTEDCSTGMCPLR